MQDLLDQNIRLMIPVGGNIHASFSRALPDSLLGQLWENSIQPHKETTLAGWPVEQSIEYVVEHNDYAIVMFASTGHGSSRYPCGIAELEEGFRRVENSFGYQKDWEFTELFNYQLNQMTAGGIIRKIWKK